MRMALAVVVLACSSPKPGPAVPNAEVGEPQKSPRIVSAETVCQQYVRLLPSCEPLSHVRWSTPTCVDYWRELLEVANQDPKRNAQGLMVASCLARNDSCNTVMQCIAADLTDPTQQLRNCEDHADESAGHAVGMPRAAWAQRRGAGVTTFRNAASTKELPIEMCGVAAATDWLTTLMCDDQSRPLSTRHAAATARSGNVGAGGRCGSIIDHYRVTCPEASYEVFIDAYVCPRPD